MFFEECFETGTYGRSGASICGVAGGSNLEYYKFGRGENVFFATFVLHGFEDNFGRDGTEVSVIAENFINELTNFGAYRNLPPIQRMSDPEKMAKMKRKMEQNQQSNDDNERG